ncbi:phosphate butyryltransferase [Caldalkalibacillus thermarum TA2.A1]|uniref:Phosphate butyryltransferase n=1 Tax=Caldalkalibacillus thermarum (strain TA2.A1) TaxID=986075 RepID=F5L5I1_CALTT|nr:phosphate butyryltransferase [Caldalkalibacillus thermarum]EGL83415.1 phosphate butyryltransferase [Caldalkalibacillus thermarum TA2.A1]QZT32670.1 phosphate butyryltransferase [Caldalkalibacillus thermarum TA2.A1]
MKLSSLITTATQYAQPTIAVAQAADEEVLRAVREGLGQRLANFYLVGDEHQIREKARSVELDLQSLSVVHEPNPRQAAQRAVQLVREGKANAVMKGLVPTADLLKAVLDKEKGLKRQRLLSHVAAFEVPGYDRLIFITDPAMNIAPDLKQKAEIIQNAVQVARAAGVKRPKVAVLAPVEVVNPAMQSTLDAASLTLMARRGQITDCEVDGPLALDNAVSVEAARHKGIRSPVAGQADILLVPNIETGNVLYKSLVYFARAKVAAVVVGAEVPVILTSRADSMEDKLYSMALAVCLLNQG